MTVSGLLLRAGVVLLAMSWSASAQEVSSLPPRQCDPLIRGVLWWINPKTDDPHLVEIMDSMSSAGMDLIWLVGPNEFLTDPDNALLKRIYAEADRRKWRVIISTSSNGRWYHDWDIPALKKIELHNVETIAKLYGRHPSFFGWYINYEIYMVWDEKSDKIRDLYRTIGQLTRQAIPKAKLTISPFFLADKDKVRAKFRYGAPAEYGDFWTETIRQAGIDIVMLQDSGAVHSECVSTETRIAFFQAMQRACKANKAELWGNVEAVERRAKDWDEYARRLKHHRETQTWYPWSFDMKRNAFKLDLASRFSTNIVSWGWEFWNPILPQAKVGNSRDNYNAYKAYYESIQRRARENKPGIDGGP